MTDTWIIYVIIFIFSAMIGSFLNVVIYRLPIMLKKQWRTECLEFLGEKPPANSDHFNLMLPRSQCPQCHKKISWWCNIPLLSYIFLKGCCVNCKNKISLRYPLIELMTALLSCLVVWQIGLSLAALLLLVFTWILIVSFFIDLDHQILPDQSTLSLLWLGLLANCFYTIVPPTDAILGAAAGYLSLWLVMHIYRLITGKIGMGHGDFKLLAAMGAWLGWQALPLIILLSAFVGTVIGVSLILFKKHQRNKPMPFGPYLAIAGWISLMWGPSIMQWYFTLAGLH